MPPMRRQRSRIFECVVLQRPRSTRRTTHDEFGGDCRGRIHLDLARRLSLILPASAALQITNANASGATTGTFTAYVVWEE